MEIEPWLRVPEPGDRGEDALEDGRVLGVVVGPEAHFTHCQHANAFRHPNS